MEKLKRFVKTLTFCSAVGLAVCLVGCKQKNPEYSSPPIRSFPAQQVIKGSDIYDLMSDLGAGNTLVYIIRDSVYEVLAEDYIVMDFSPVFIKKLTQTQSWIYQIEENDCDDFALSALDLMADMHRRNPNHVKFTGIAFGEFYYKPDIQMNEENHAINVAIIQKNGRNIVIFYAPETRKIVELSKNEIESCIFWRF